MENKSRWKIAEKISQAMKTQVFSGGACNILDVNGKLLRNRGA